MTKSKLIKELRNLHTLARMAPFIDHNRTAVDILFWLKSDVMNYESDIQFWLDTLAYSIVHHAAA